MNQRIYSILDFEKIREMLHKELFTASGKKKLKNLYPATDLSVVKEWLKETSEMKEIIVKFGKIPFIYLVDIQKWIRESEIKGSILTPDVLLKIVRTLECIHLIQNYFGKIDLEEYPLLKKNLLAIKMFRSLEKEIKRCIDEGGQVLDEASPSLKKIRQQIRNTEGRIHEKLESIIKDTRYRTFIQDNIITIRQGRYVIPVKQQEKGKLPGIYHDRSESGVTVFIEPMPVVELNNRLRELYQEEKKEEYRILQQLTVLVSHNSADILESYYGLGLLDCIHGKAILSTHMKGIEPNINTTGKFHLIQARHPLLKGNAIPIDMQLGDKFSVLIITGPNTGGKTVTLKTVGLLHLMAQTGLHIPAGIDSEVALFENIFGDIGDEQSMEQNLSTFSSHMQQIIEIIRSSNSSSLILLDELGAGTDPSEGSALSMAILDLLRQKGSKVLCTTHHDSIKAYAYLTEGVMNARVEFDEKTLQPTYEVSIGLPGKSCAFAVARRLGLSGKVIESAKKYLDREKIDLENLIKTMEMDRNRLAKNVEESEKLKDEILEMKKSLELRKNQLEKEREEMILQAYQEAQGILSTTQRRVREIVQSSKRKKNDPGKDRQELTNLETLKQEVNQNIAQFEIGEDLLDSDEDLAIGERVLVKKLQREGIITEKNLKKKQYQIQVDHLKLTVPFQEVQKISRISRKTKKIENKQIFELSTSQDRLTKKAVFHPEISIRQMTVRDAQIKLEKYLDDAFLLNVSPVYVIHGKGKGILREFVVQLLNSLPYVKSYRCGEMHEGGDGVTVVYF